MFNKLKIYIEKISKIGTYSVSDKEEIRRIQNSNYIILLAMFANIQHLISNIIINFLALIPIILIILAFLFSYFIPLYLNHKKKYNLAKVILSLIITLNVLIPIVFVVGQSLQLSLYFTFYVIFPLLIWSLKDYIYILFFFIFNLGCYLYIQFIDKGEYAFLAPLYKDADIFILIDIMIAFVVLLSIIFLYQRSVYKYENQLKTINLELKEKSEEVSVLVSEVEMNRDELVETNHTKDKFFSIIAHDLKNPFMVIMGLSELMITNFNSLNHEETKKYIAALNESAQKTYKLLENLLDWARTQKGIMPYKPIPLLIYQLIADNNETLFDMANEKKITIYNNIPSDIEVIGDENMIKGIFRNLISNAIKFSNPNNSIDINVNQLDSEYEFSVEDYGVGIPENDILKVFRIDINHTTHGTNLEEGTGLGLILCKEFVEKHGGKIWVESTVNIGSKFKFTIPR